MVRTRLALTCHTRCSPLLLPASRIRALLAAALCFLMAESNPLCAYSVDLIWGLNLSSVFLSFLDCAALPSWQGNIGFAPYLEVISVLGLQGGEKGSSVFPFHFLFRTIPQSLFVQSLLDIFSPALTGSAVTTARDIDAIFLPFPKLGSRLRLLDCAFLGCSCCSLQMWVSSRGRETGSPASVMPVHTLLCKSCES